MADDILSLSNFSMLELFNMEVETQTEILNDNLISLENYLKKSLLSSSFEISTLLEALMRAAHSIKGAARIVDIDEAVKIAHLMEDYFSATINQSIIPQGEHIDHLLEGVDLLQKIGKNQEENLKQWLQTNQEEIEQALGRIGELLGRRKSDSTSQLAPAKTQAVQIEEPSQTSEDDFPQ